MEQSLKNRLYNYLRNVFLYDPKKWIHKSYLEQLAKNAGYLGDNCTRRLREMVNDRQIDHRKTGKSQEYRYCPNMDEIAQVADKLL